MLSILRHVLSQLRLVRRFGFLEIIKIKWGRPRALVKLRFDGEDVYVRARTPDFDVALSGFSGEFNMLDFLLPSSFDGLIVDAGANIGTSAIILRKKFPFARIILIEPFEENLMIAKMNTQNLNVEYVLAALVSENSTNIPLRNRGTGEVGFTIVDTPADKPDAVEIAKVNGVSLAAIIAGERKLGILKMDIEGSELELFKNCPNTLRKFSAVFVELHERIAPGCEAAFFEFSADRIVVKGDGEKYLSVSK